MKPLYEGLLTDMNLRKALRNERMRLNISRWRLAEKAGVGENTIYRFECDPACSPSFRTAEKIADALGYRILVKLDRKEAE